MGTVETPAGPIELRTERPEDLPFLRALYASTRQEELARLPWTPYQKAGFLESQFALQHQHYRQHYAQAQFEVIELEGQAIGRIYVHRTEEIRLMDIALLPEFRRKGIGGVLLKGLMEEARFKNQYLTLHVEEENPAYGWYTRLGFKAVELRGVYWFMRWP